LNPAAGANPEPTSDHARSDSPAAEHQAPQEKTPVNPVRVVRHIMFATVIIVLGVLLANSEIRGIRMLHGTDLIALAIVAVVTFDIAVLEFLIVAYYRSYNPTFEYKTFATTLGDAATAPLVAMPSLSFKTLLLAQPSGSPSTTVSRVAARTDWIVSIDRERLNPAPALTAPAQEGFYHLEPAHSGPFPES
jgi:hypothetical protein